MGNFAENLNLGNRFRPPPLCRCWYFQTPSVVHCMNATASAQSPKFCTKFLPANNFCQLLRVTRKRSCTFGMINRGCLELATSPIGADAPPNHPPMTKTDVQPCVVLVYSCCKMFGRRVMTQSLIAMILFFPLIHKFPDILSEPVKNENQLVYQVLRETID